MKIVINSLNNIDGVAIYPIISFIIFFVFFLLVGYLVYKTPKSFADQMSRFPLDENENAINDGFTEKK